jgi:hypothetical protein
LDAEKKNQLFAPLVTKYCDLFRQVATLAFDLGPFMPFLSDYNFASEFSKGATDKSSYKPSELLASFDQAIAEQEDPARKARIQLNLYRMQLLLGVATLIEEPAKLVQQLQDHYLSACKLDSKPLKGERKMADDFVLMASEVLQAEAEKESASSPVLDESVLYRVGLLEYALTLSPDNFDIQLDLAQIYDTYGLSMSFSQAHANLGMKGVQLESMGYLQMRHCSDWGVYQSLFKPTYQKYEKYWTLNSQNLRQSKQQSFSEDNYEAIENYVEFERFLLSSYFYNLQALQNK